MADAGENEWRFSAKFEERLGSAGPPTQAPVAGVRDVIVCVKGGDQVDPADFREHPPVGAAQWMRHHRGPEVYLPWSEDAVIWRLDRRREYLDGPEAEDLAQLLGLVLGDR
jgi:hypothetical protein